MHWSQRLISVLIVETKQINQQDTSTSVCRSSFQNTKYNKADSAYASHVVTIFYFNLVRLDGMEIKLSSRQKQEEFEIVIFSWRQMKKAEKYEASTSSKCFKCNETTHPRDPGVRSLWRRFLNQLETFNGIMNECKNVLLMSLPASE